MWSMQNCRTLILCLAVRCSCNASCKSREVVCAQVAVITVEESSSQCSVGRERLRVSLHYNLQVEQVLRFQGGPSGDHTLTEKAARKMCTPHCSISKFHLINLHFSFVFPENFLNFCWVKYICIWGYASVGDTLLSWERLPFYGIAQEGNAGIWQYWARKKWCSTKSCDLLYICFSCRTT